MVMGTILTGLGAGMSFGCDGTRTAIGTQHQGGTDGSAATGSTAGTDGAAATGGATTSGGAAAAGGATGTGGVTATDGAVMSGGATATGGAAMTGGAAANGGAAMTGGATATGGTAIAGGTKATEGSVATAGSVAAGGALATGGTGMTAGGATATGGIAGIGGSPRTPDAADPGDSGPDANVADLSFDARRYPSEKYLVWQAPAGATNLGPALVVSQGASGAGTVVTWDSVGVFPPEMPVSSYAGSYPVSAPVLTDLFARLASIDFSLLPHSASVVECSPTLYFRQCMDCPATLLSYHRASQLVPEMESVWAWFDSVLGATLGTNPRNYCNL